MIPDTLLTIIVFLTVYLGMIAGRLPWLALDRTGIAITGMVILLAAGSIEIDDAVRAVDVPTLALLFGLMVVSAQFRLGGFYSAVTRRLGESVAGPKWFLLLVILTSGGLSALLANDIICLAMSPLLLQICRERHFHPLPYLAGLACAANIGSAATLIGNPQNMLLGQVLEISFAGYMLRAIPIAMAGLLACWGVIVYIQRNNWECISEPLNIDATPFDAWQTYKGILVLLCLVVMFLGGWFYREIVALMAAGVLLVSRRMASRQFLALIDWNLLLLFIGLFVVNRTLMDTGLPERAIQYLAERNMDLTSPVLLFVAAVLGSNLVSNVPAVMLLLPVATHPDGGVVLAVASTLAGNLFLVGSIANLIVVEQAARYGFKITWADHFRYGLPVTVATLAIAALWLWIS